MLVGTHENNMLVNLVASLVRYDDFVLPRSKGDSVLRRLLELAVLAVGLLLDCFNLISRLVNGDSDVNRLVGNKGYGSHVRSAAADGLYTAATAQSEKRNAY